MLDGCSDDGDVILPGHESLDHMICVADIQLHSHAW
jgi:hypothetical protein